MHFWFSYSGYRRLGRLLLLVTVVGLFAACSQAQSDGGEQETDRLPGDGDPSELQSRQVIEPDSFDTGERHIRWTLANGEVTGLTERQLNEYLGEDASTSGYGFFAPKLSPDATQMMVVVHTVGPNYGQRPGRFIVVASGAGELTGIYATPFGLDRDACNGYPFHSTWVEVSGKPSILIDFGFGTGKCAGLVLVRTDGTVAWETPTATQRPNIYISTDQEWVALDEWWSDDPIVEFFALDDPSMRFLLQRDEKLPPELPGSDESIRASELEGAWARIPRE